MKIFLAILALLVVAAILLFFWQSEFLPGTSSVTGDGEVASSNTSTDTKPAMGGNNVTVCHFDKDKNLKPNFSVDKFMTYPAIQSAASSLKGITAAMKLMPKETQKFGNVLTANLSAPALVSIQLMYATCSVLDKNGNVTCEDEVTSAIMGYQQNTEIAPDGAYVRNITTKEGENIVVTGQKGDPSNVRIVTAKTDTVWTRSPGGVETITTISDAYESRAIENPDCSGSYVVISTDGTKEETEWQYLSVNNTTGSFVSTSPNPNLNLTVNW